MECGGKPPLSSTGKPVHSKQASCRPGMECVSKLTLVHGKAVHPRARSLALNSTAKAVHSIVA